MENRNALFFTYANEYLHKYLPKQREMSVHTEKSYTDALSLFRRYAFEIHGLTVDKLKFEHVNFDFVTGYAMWLKVAVDGKKGSSAQTCNLRVSAIRSYVRFAMSKDAGLASIWIQLKGIQPIKTTKPEKEILSENALKTMIHISSKNERLGLRNSTLLVLMYDSACRISEILNLKMCDISLFVAQPHIFVTGKGKKERRIPLMDRTVAYLKEYTSVFHASNLGTDYLFYTVIKDTAGPLSQDCISKVLKKAADEARYECPDIPDKIHAHILRNENLNKITPCQNII